MKVKTNITEGFTYLKPKSDEEMRKDFNPGLIKSQLAATNIDIVAENSNHIIAKINKYEDAAVLGSPSWHSVKSKSSFDNVADAFHNLYFIWDFTIPADPLRFISVSVGPDGNIKSAYDAMGKNVAPSYFSKFN